MQELTPEQLQEALAAEAARVREAVATIDGTIAAIETQLATVEAGGDERSAARLRKSLTSLNKRKQELQSGERQA